VFCSIETFGEECVSPNNSLFPFYYVFQYILVLMKLKSVSGK